MIPNASRNPEFGQKSIDLLSCSCSLTKVIVRHDSRAFLQRDLILERYRSIIVHRYVYPNPRPNTIMPKTCLNCKAVALKDVPTLSCGACRAAVYCSKVCQKEHWKSTRKSASISMSARGACKCGIQSL
jgi:hypothetical protein